MIYLQSTSDPDINFAINLTDGNRLICLDKRGVFVFPDTNLHNKKYITKIELMGEVFNIVGFDYKGSYYEDSHLYNNSDLTCLYVIREPEWTDKFVVDDYYL